MKQTVRLAFLGMVFLGIFFSSAAAHKVIVFAWVEQGMVHIEGSFGGKNTVHQGKITVTDQQGQVIYKGTTDHKGYLAFPLPKAGLSDLTVLLDAGPAHQATWVIRKDELEPVRTAADAVSVEEKKAELEKRPSVFHILAGLTIIGLFFTVIALIKKRGRRRD